MGFHSKHKLWPESYIVRQLIFCRIEKDVCRCDRNLSYFANANLEKLRNIITTYVWENLDVGYMQVRSALIEAKPAVTSCSLIFGWFFFRVCVIWLPPCWSYLMMSPSPIPASPSWWTEWSRKLLLKIHLQITCHSPFSDDPFCVAAIFQMDPRWMKTLPTWDLWSRCWTSASMTTSNRMETSATSTFATGT